MGRLFMPTSHRRDRRAHERNFVSLIARECENLADFVMGFHRVAQAHLGIDVIDVAPSLAAPNDHQTGLEIAEDLEDGAFGYADRAREIAHACRGFAREGDQHVSVIGEKRPARTSGRRGNGIDTHRNIMISNA